MVNRKSDEEGGSAPKGLRRRYGFPTRPKLIAAAGPAMVQNLKHDEKHPK